MAMSRGRFIIRDDKDKRAINRKYFNKTNEIVEPLKRNYIYADPLDNKRIERSLNRINRRKQK